MRISRTLTALAIIGAVVAGVTGLFLASTAMTASATSAAVEPGGYGYGSKSPTPSRTRFKSTSASATPSPSGTLPETGQHAGSLVKTGLITMAAGFVLILGVAIWQARSREHRSRAPERHPFRRR